MIIEIKDIPQGRKVKRIKVDVTFEDEKETTLVTTKTGFDIKDDKPVYAGVNSEVKITEGSAKTNVKEQVGGSTPLGPPPSPAPAPSETPYYVGAGLDVNSTDETLIEGSSIVSKPEITLERDKKEIPSEMLDLDL